ncbi:manganese efflux pump MntP family protein [Paenibacillus sp. 1P07SE]|uniref:manganese efflux pump MntP n=1 Tax=Paenibacillus sp. 1P07SE TaxID=3132209 RepID=UPI0039A65CB7
MGEATVPAGQLMTIVLMAVALGMDAFSLGIGIGLKGIRLRHVLRLSCVIALFHVAMPLLGILTGNFMSGLLGQVATTAAGVLLFLLGAHMVYHSLRPGSESSIDHRSLWGTLLLGLTVSVDSFSVGVSLGMFSANMLLTVLMFGLFGGLMSIIGLLIGRRAGGSLGDYGEACGGIILLVFGLMFLF